MKICYRLIISNPNSVELFPPSLQAYRENLLSVNEMRLNYLEEPTQVVNFFDSYEDLNTYYNSNKMTAEQEATHNEWKTANNISITYEVYELVGTPVPNII